MKHRLLYIMAFLFAATQTFAQTYTYDSNNRLTKVVYDNGTTITYTFDALGNRTGKKVTGSTAVRYTISVSVTPSGSGTVTGGGTYAKGTTIELNAIANAGYKFSMWSDGSTDNPRNVVVTGDKTYVAQFVESSSSIIGDIVIDGKVNVQDLNALVDTYLANTQVTSATDIDKDSQLSVADITKLISMIYSEPCDFDNNGHAYVDLGLPSGALWATCNVGASAPEETGSLFAWGETEPKETYSWETYKFTNGSKPTSSNASITKYGVTGNYGVVDNKVTLDDADDVAVESWGGDWHMPTNEDFQELIDNTTQLWTKLNNVRGYLFTGTNGNTMFIPEGNNSCWSSSLRTSGGHGTNADQLHYNSTDIGVSGGLRYKGYPVRPILSEKGSDSQIEVPSSYRNHDLVDLGLPSRTLWATCNLGADSPEDYGCYYAWGETNGSCEGKTSFSYSTYNDYDGNNMVEYTTDGKTKLDADDDVAHVKWGGEWRMPTYKEFSELINTSYTQSEWTNVNGIAGYRITSIVEGCKGNSIFLPAAGRYHPTLKEAGERGDYWASNMPANDDSSDYAYYLRIGSSTLAKGTNSRHYGTSVRPVVSLSDIK